MKIKVTTEGRRKIQDIIVTQLNKRQQKSLLPIQLSLISTMIANVVETGKFIEWHE